MGEIFSKKAFHVGQAFFGQIYGGWFYLGGGTNDRIMQRELEFHKCIF